VAAVRSAASDGKLQVAEEDLERWLAWARAHAEAIDPLNSDDALGTELLWNEDAVQRDLDRKCNLSDDLGDPSWFWGHRWWLKG
jgi:hypothetical protein